MVKPKGLGRGINALITGSAQMNQLNTEPANVAGKLVTLSRDVIQAGQYQPRSHMDETALNELAQSLREQGMMQPIIVRSIADDRYEIIAGERRYRAAGIAGMSDVPALIREVSDKDALSLALIENIQREDLNPLEEAQGLQRLISEFDYTHETCAQAIGRSRSAVSNLLRLMNLAPAVQTMLLEGDVEMGHARALLSLPNAEQVMLAQEISQKGWSVRETEKQVGQRQNKASKPSTGKSATKTMSTDIVQLQEQLSDSLGAQVTIQMIQKNQGKLTIHFANLDVLDGILAKIHPHGEK